MLLFVYRNLQIIYTAFNTDAIVYDNSPWRPGRDIQLVNKSVSEEDERKLKNLATRIMSNGVEVLVKDKHPESGKLEQRKIKVMHLSSHPGHQKVSPKQSLLSSAVATVVNRQQISAMIPLHQFMQHNYIIKTCLTTFTYLTTVVQNKRSAISTFETIVSVVTTESLANPYATDLMPDIKPTKTKFIEVKTIHPAPVNHIYQSNVPKIDKRIDNEYNDNDHSNFDIIQPSEMGHTPCTSSCSCSHTKTEGLNTKFNSNLNNYKNPIKSSKYEATKLDVRPTTLDKKTQYGPYEYESHSQSAPTDKIVEKYTEVMNDYSDEKDSSVVEESELLTNEQAPSPSKIATNKPDKSKPEKPQKPNKNKFIVADLLKLGSLGIKGLSQLAPVIEKMTGGFMKRQDNINKTTTTTSTTVKPVGELTPYLVNKRIDSESDKNSNFPIYIPVDDMDTSESQLVFTNATLHQNLAWVAEHKNSKAYNVPTKMVHESPLLNGGISISPGDIITANSDVIVGKPAVGGPLTLAASGITLQNPVNPPPLDSFVSANEQLYIAKEKPSSNEFSAKVDDSFDLRPPELPKTKPNRNVPRPISHHDQFVHNSAPNKMHYRPHSSTHQNDNLMKTEQMKTSTLGNHGRPAFLDYIPSFAQPESNSQPIRPNMSFSYFKDELDVSDNNPSSSEIVDTRVKLNGEFVSNQKLTESSKPFLVDIQPSRVANVLIPHGSSTALVFAGSSEPHKTGDYIDDPLPYPEPGYFGSFSIDAPQMTNVQNVPPSYNNKPSENKQKKSPSKESSVYKFEQTWDDKKRPMELNKLPPPTSNQETHLHVGPQITVYNPDIYKPTSNGNFEKYNHKFNKDGKEIIDKEYENYLAVPPPPPRKIQSNYENNHYNQKPIIHTKPIQDMKVFLNIQHPVPKPHKGLNLEKLPPKVTSEVYYAAQSPQNIHSPSYTIHIPNSQNSEQSAYNHQSNNRNPVNHLLNPFQTHNPQIEHNSFNIVSSPNIISKPGSVSDVNDKDNTYTVTLNTAANVANSVSETGQIIGSSIPISVGVSNNNADIPIGTNFAIKVEDGSSPLNNYNIPVQQNRIPPVVYNYNGQAEHTKTEVKVEDNRWNTSAVIDVTNSETSTNRINYHSSTTEYNEINSIHNQTPKKTLVTSLNSHANFPMTNDVSTPSNDVVKPVTEYIDDIKPEQKRPAKLIPNIPTNSHGWYSSEPINDYKGHQVNEVTTRKAIPLLFEYHHDSVPDFGQKISGVGKPPTDLWVQTKPHLPHVGKPFTTQSTAKPLDQIHQFTSKPLNSNYIPHNLGSVRQPVYDIPVRDNSDETTTSKLTNLENQKKPAVYEDYHEVFDGKEESEPDLDSEISSETMQEPVVSSSIESDNKREESKSSTEITLLQEEIITNPKKNQGNKNVQFVEFNPGTQTEKPFDINSYNRSSHYYSNSIKPIDDRKPHAKPRPFTINTANTLDHQLQQPHWQINQLMENSTNMSYEDNVELNIGEEMSTMSSPKPTSTQKIPYGHQNEAEKYKRPQRPVFSVRPSGANESNIITSTVHLKDKKPLTVLDDTRDKGSTLPSFTIPASNFDLNRSSSEIIDLSPPPPTMDFDFKPTTMDELIMGMSPPPRDNLLPPMRLPTRSPVTPRPIRTPPSYRTKPPRTTSPRVPTNRSTKKPINRDDISTFRPIYDVTNIVKRPNYNRGQPSSQLLPPPNMLSRISPVNDVLSSPSTITPAIPNVVFPTPVSSGWLTSSGVGFSSPFDFGPTKISGPSLSSNVPQILEVPSTDKSFSYEPDVSSSTELIDNTSSESPIIENRDSIPVGNGETTTEILKSSEETNISDAVPSETSHEDVSTEKVEVIPLRNKSRTRKPYPGRDEDKKSSVYKYKLPSKPVTIIKPTRTLTRPDYPSRHLTTRKILRPMPTKLPTVQPSLIQSSESVLDDELIQPTVVISDEKPSVLITDKTVLSVKTPPLESSILLKDSESVIPLVKPTHHAGNEIKIVDEVVPTKTEFKTTVITLTKTLSEAPITVSSIGYVNLTHTLTVTQTKTSLVSQFEGAKTQTLILTNTLTSTIVDVITEIRTQIQPTTIIETVTKHIPISQIEPTPVKEIPTKTRTALDDVTMSSEEKDNFIIRDSETTEAVQKIEQNNEGDNESFFVVMNKSQNGGQSPPLSNEIETGDYDVTRNEQVNSNGVSQVLFGEILLAGTPYLETTNVANPTGIGYAKECQPDCKASRNERCQRIDGLMKCVCRPGFARMFPDRPCKPTYTYSVNLALSSQGKERLVYHESLADNSTAQYSSLALATHEGINRMVMQSDLRDVYHGVHITGFHPVEISGDSEEPYQGVMNDFYVQLSDNAHESRLKEVIEKYLRNNNYSLGGTAVFAASELMDKLNVSDFDECLSGQFHDCSEHAQCFNLRGTYTCSCLEGFADLSVNSLYPGRICSAEPVGCEKCNYHGACYSRDDSRVLCECFQWYAGSSCHINLKVVLISLVTAGALLAALLAASAVLACRRGSAGRRAPPPRLVACMQGMPSLPQSAQILKQRADRRALISERADSGDASSLQNASLPYMPVKKQSGGMKKLKMSEPPAHEAPPPPPAPAVMIPRARLLPTHRDSREMASRKQSLELSSEAKLISYLESGANANNEEMMRRKHSLESSYSAPKDRHVVNKQGALVSAGFKVSTTVRPDDPSMTDRDDLSSVNKNDLEAELARFGPLRQSYSHEELSEWTDAERRMGELTLSEARSVGGTLPASTGRAASSTRLTHQEANTMAERDLGSTFLLPHVHLYKPDITSDVSEFDSL